MDPWKGLKLWWESHAWASDCVSGGRSDLVMAMANLGPVGIWPSLGTTVKDMAMKHPGVMTYQDLRISKLSIASLKARLASDFPQYVSIISSYSVADWEDGVRKKYHYALATLLHTHLYTDITSIQIHNPKNKTERSAILGHVQVISARCKTLDRK
eukprot:916811-Rhodomonas_salina.1